jgi:hypothetical protein
MTCLASKEVFEKVPAVGGYEMFWTSGASTKQPREVEYVHASHLKFDKQVWLHAVMARSSRVNLVEENTNFRPWTS